MGPVLVIKGVPLEEEKIESGPKKKEISTGRVSKEDASGKGDQVGQSTKTEKHKGFERRVDMYWLFIGPPLISLL